MLETRDLEQVTASARLADELISQAGAHLASAGRIADDDPVGAFQLLYDAARKALCAVLESPLTGSADSATTPSCPRTRSGHV